MAGLSGIVNTIPEEDMKMMIDRLKDGKTYLVLMEDGEKGYME